MRKFLLMLFLFSFINGFSQPGNKRAAGKIGPKLITNDSVLVKLKQQGDSMVKETLKKEELKQIEQSSQKNAKEKRNAVIRIAIGIVLLIVLILGLRRRVKK
jgi:uncharacterized membrane protein